VLAHGSVLSREYGIPAITSVKEATKLITDGSTIRLDANKGVVYLECE
jgi:pyruvate,water dikinase